MDIRYERKSYMKKFLLIFLIPITLVLSSCGLLEEVNSTVEYVNTATEHINQLSTFGENAPQLIQEALSNTNALQDLEQQLNQLKQEIESFIALEDIPAIAEDIHQELVVQNENLLSEINKVMVDGQLAVEQLQSSEVITTISEISNLLNQIENIGG